VSRWLRRLALPAAVAVAALFTLTPAAFAADDPGGNNGSVKIQTDLLDDADSTANDPHINDCAFNLAFFGFDENQYADITFTIQSPSEPTDPATPVLMLSQTHVLISTTNAGGDKNDVDAVLHYTADDLHVANYTAHDVQGFHIKVEVDSPQLPGGKKSKVFWLQACTPTTTTSSSGGGGGSSSTDPGDPGTSTSPGGGGSLPLTGTAVGGIVAAGVGLVAAGTVLVVARRRRDATDAS
jgi:LPXTG-motif cell wall-anchored protein